MSKTIEKKISAKDAFNEIMKQTSVISKVALEQIHFGLCYYNNLKTLADGKKHTINLNGKEAEIQLSKTLSEEDIITLVLGLGIGLGQELATKAFETLILEEEK